MAKIYDNPDNWFNTSKKTGKSKGTSRGGVVYKSSSKSSNNSSQNTKKSISKIAKGTNQKLPQVVVKITGGSKGADKAQSHLKYIMRNGDIAVENERGETYQGKEYPKQLMNEWRSQGMHLDEATGTRKEAFHIVFSMPTGTDPVGLKNAVRETVKAEFEGHQYFMAQHLDTDEPHIHILLRAVDNQDKRLNPRKADLDRYRATFVAKLKEQGIEATTSRRIHRFKAKEPKKQGVYHRDMREHRAEKKPTPQQKRSINTTHQQVAKAYKNYAKQLSPDDRELKRDIEKMIKDFDKNQDMSR